MGKEVLSFDLTGTLATFRFCDSIWFEGLPRLYAEKHAIDFKGAREHLRRAYDEIGDAAVEWYDIKYWFNRFRLGNEWQSLLEEFSYNIEFYPESEAVLSELGQRYELILITNACREFVDVEIADIKRHFNQVISCVSDFGEVKKTPAFYSRICRFLGREPSDLIHVGDHWQFDFVAPRDFGMNAFYLDRTRERTGEYIIHNLNEMQAKLI